MADTGLVPSAPSLPRRGCSPAAAGRDAGPRRRRLADTGQQQAKQRSFQEGLALEGQADLTLGDWGRASETGSQSERGGPIVFIIYTPFVSREKPRLFNAICRQNLLSARAGGISRYFFKVVPPQGDGPAVGGGASAATNRKASQGEDTALLPDVDTARGPRRGREIQDIHLPDFHASSVGDIREKTRRRHKRS